MAGVGILATTALLLAGCSAGPAESDGPVTIEFFNFTAGADHEAQLQRIVDAFEDENPNITVKVQNAPYEDYFTSLKTRIAGNTAPDTFELNYENFVSFASSGALLDLETAAPDAIDKSVYFPKAYDAFNFDGVQLGLPESFSVVVLIYNKDLFDAAGLDYPTADWTWADEKAAAEKLTNAGAGVFGEYQPVQFFEFYKSLAQSGGEFFNDDMTKATFNSEAGIAAAHHLVDKVGNTMPNEAQMGGIGDDVLFQQGKIAMWHNGIWQFNNLLDIPSKWDVVVEPGNTQHASHFFANAGVASASTKHPVESAKWLQYLASSDLTVDIRLNEDWELPAVADKALLEPYLSITPPENRQAVFDSLDSVVVPPVIERQQELQDIVTLYLQKAVLGELSVEDALNQAVQEVNALL
ncbi:sugar ABC transporter substrate-binding protein [Terrimesophilobacter mesophilus]|uniref:Sugar ABC transporter substrate-binding protein n=2 Tax=Terrimesophilobacter mesophilus TaxID=433647 RepID=A0A4R8VFW4_9MICO|nr:sugar ABC transporter substrate-binding protein [Terrimesophilobacter mesophilus]